MAKKTNFEVNGKSYYKITRTVGHKPDGTAIKKVFYGTGVKEANEKADKYINDLKMGLLDGKHLITVNSLFPKWLFGIKKNEVKASTFESYYSTYKRFIEPADFSDIPINEIKALKIQYYYNDLSTTPNNVKKTNKVLNMFFGYAEKEGYIIKNPCKNISLPKEKKAINTILEKKQYFQYYNEDEINKLKEVFKGNKFENVVLFALGTGMRRGEIFGLQWSDLDFDKKEIHVIHNLSYLADISTDGKKEYHIKLNSPKTENSVRIIPMSTNIYNLLSSMEKSSDFVFAPNNGHFDLKYFQKVYQGKLKEAGIKNKTFHDLRHTFATMLITHGANLITVKELLGHSSIKTTEIYLEALPKTKTDVIEKIDYLLNQVDKK